MIAVTGGTGLLGTHVLFMLTEKQVTVRALYRHENRQKHVMDLFRLYDPEGAEARFDRIQWINGDILDLTSLEELIEKGSTVYHCAALVSFRRRDFSKLMQVNREGTENVVNICLKKGAFALCHVSSVAAIHAKKGQPVTEKNKWEVAPETSAYGVSKYNAERAVWRGMEEGLNAVIVNPSVIFGGGIWTESSMTIFRTMKQGQLFYPPGSNATVDARDVARIMICLVEGKIWNERFLCVGSNQSFRTLMGQIAVALGKNPPRFQLPYSLGLFAQKTLSILDYLGLAKPALTRETLQSMFASVSYDTTKVQERLDYSFYPLEEQIVHAIKHRLD